MALSVGVWLAASPPRPSRRRTRGPNRGFPASALATVALWMFFSHSTFLIGITLVCFAVCYACLMRQEVRST
jgi:hypothetical protein